MVGFHIGSVEPFGPATSVLVNYQLKDLVML
jgi:hypothetical protein